MHTGHHHDTKGRRKPYTFLVWNHGGNPRAARCLHLIPRVYALCTDGLAPHTEALGFGKFITSIMMTVFYLLLFRIWELRYNRHRLLLRTGMYLLALLRIALCFFPQMDKSGCTA